MNKMRVFLLFAVLVGVISACQSKSEQTAGQEQDTMDDSLAVAPTEDEKTIFGVVEDASMNNFMLVTSKGDTVFVSTMDQEPSEVGRLRTGRHRTGELHRRRGRAGIEYDTNCKESDCSREEGGSD